ncbi:LysR family transcriptional regulator ArgP [Thaumasiovibrio subtropicus]|uniref:LysR family transcriptional regulator ArgP n=1 Tax=Thaumasiovibrio subtropicus TaxID=1891207 RepID=UPI000B3568CC|nr:LysR family transcriptional regulator ArgP [Thaumasiovibrio subtropicus]
MSHIDYKAVAALEAVLATGGFELAAQRLFVTQSAISQRIKQLEQAAGEPLLIRSSPPAATDAGQRLLGLYQQVKLLEREWWPKEGRQVTDLSIASNHDSLAIWLLPALQPLLTRHEVALNIELADEKNTLDKLRRGEVIAAISVEPQPITGCSVDYLGQLPYRCVASPSFVARYFPYGLTSEAIRHAPGIVFDQYDEMHQAFLAHHFDIQQGDWRCHTLRSPEAFITMATLDLGYGMIPEVMIERELASGELVDLLPGHGFCRHLYWHRWSLQQGIVAEMTACLLDAARSLPQRGFDEGVY